MFMVAGQKSNESTNMICNQQNIQEAFSRYPQRYPHNLDLLLIATLTIKAKAPGIISQWPLSFSGFSTSVEQRCEHLP
jgi:hypothetical protein